MAAALRKPEHFWPLVWGAACLALAGVIAAEVMLGEVEAGRGARAPAAAAEAKLLPAFALAPEVLAGGETTTRPLFMPGRRPAPPAASADSGVMKKGQFVLQGTTVVGDLAFAMLMEVASNRLHRVQKGGKLNELTLTEVGPTFAVLALGTDSETVPLLVAKASGTPAPDRGPFASPEGAAAPAAAAPATAPAQPPAPGSRRTAVQAPAPALPADAAAARAAARQARQGRQQGTTPSAPAGGNPPVSFDDLARQRLEALKQR